MANDRLASSGFDAASEIESVRPGVEPARVGDWIQTYTGLVMYPLDPRGSEICIEDIAHALSNLCRFTGHVREFYSVAEHSVYVSYQCDLEDALWGLLHDASEAYLADMSRPMKRSPGFGPIYMEAEARLMRVICLKYGLSAECPSSVTTADHRLLMTEKRDLLPRLDEQWGREWCADIQPASFEIRYPKPPRQAANSFMRRFSALTSPEMARTIELLRGEPTVEPAEPDVETNSDRGQ
jgi:uncharacterized protein